MAVYMQVEGIKGSSTEKNHIEWIPIKSCEFPVNRPGVNTVPGKISDRLRSSVDFPDITMRKDSDMSSPNLMKWMVEGLTKKVIIVFCKEKGEEVLRLTLYDTVITDLNTTVNADEQPEETVKLDFTRIDMVFTTYNAQNKFGGNFPVNYDLGKASVV